MEDSIISKQNIVSFLESAQRELADLEEEFSGGLDQSSRKEYLQGQIDAYTVCLGYYNGD